MPRRIPRSWRVTAESLVPAGLEREVAVCVEAEQAAVVDDAAAERNLVVKLASVGRGAADEIRVSFCAALS